MHSAPVAEGDKPNGPGPLCKELTGTEKSGIHPLKRAVGRSDNCLTDQRDEPIKIRRTGFCDESPRMGKMDVCLIDDAGEV
jgi:hypothetical protein